jgi:amino acid transporter
MATMGALGSDEQRLAELGYKQELNRGWSSFSNFAISFSIICVLAGCFTTYGQAFNNGGPIAISIGWPVISVLILTVAFSMSELASAMPTAGGIYYWASKLGGPAWGWFTGWFNLIGLVAVTASVDYICAQFIQYLFNLFGVHFIFNFTSTNVKYNAHVVMVLFILILLLGLLVNVFWNRLLTVFNGVAVWWNVLGVAVIVVILIAVPSHHASLSYVFGHRINNSGFSGGMYWFYVLPIGFLLTMYTITGYDASAHVSEETHGASKSAAQGVWRSVFYSAVVGYVVLLALTFAVNKAGEKGMAVSATVFPILSTSLSLLGAKAVVLISTIGQLFCGIACMTSGSRMTFAFARDGAIPGHNLWRRLGANRTPTWAVLFIAVFAFVITIPAYFPNSAGTPVAFLAITSISVIGLYIAYTIPVFLRWRAGSRFEPGPWTLGSKYKWVNLIACVWVFMCVFFFSFPLYPAGVPGNKAFSWNSVNYAPLVVVFVMLSVTVWYFGWAKNTFKGPLRTIDLPDEGGAPAAPPAPVVA